MIKVKQLNFFKGRRAENLAKAHLLNKGYQFVEQNFKNEVGEIDLIFRQNQDWIFVEVKMKQNDRLGQPEEMLNLSKLNQVKKVAISYCLARKININQTRLRLEAICVIGQTGGTFMVRHYADLEC